MPSVVGARVGTGLRSAHARAGDWYFKVFTNYGNLAPYCVALQRPIGGPDHSVCTRHGKDPDDPANTAFTSKSKPGYRVCLSKSLLKRKIYERALSKRELTIN